MLNFPGSSSKQMSHYIDIHREDKSIDSYFACWCEMIINDK